ISGKLISKIIFSPSNFCSPIQSLSLEILRCFCANLWCRSLQLVSEHSILSDLVTMENQKEFDELAKKVDSLMSIQEDLVSEFKDNYNNHSPQLITSIKNLSAELKAVQDRLSKVKIDEGLPEPSSGFTPKIDADLKVTPTTAEEGNCRSTPKIDFIDINGSSVTNSVRDYKVRSEFLVYQEGKPFIPSTSFVVDSQGKSAAYHEVNNFNTLNLNYNGEPQQFEDWNFIDGDNINRFTSVCDTSSSVFYTRLIFDRGRYFDGSILMNKYNNVYKFLKNYVIIPILRITAISVVLPSSNRTRMIFDRGKKIEVIRRNSCYVECSSKFSKDTLASCVLVNKWQILMDECCGNSVYELVLELGYNLELLFVHPNVFMFVKSGDSHDARKLSGKIFQQVILPWTNGVLLVIRENKPENTQELFEQLLVRDFRLSTHIEEDWKEFMEQEIISANNTMLLAWKLNFLHLNPWVCLPEIELFIFFLPGEYVKKMHGSVVHSLSEDADSLPWRLSSGLSIGIKILNVGSMKTSI
ncbi:hypothetical protein MKW98_003228, partial [Papaver atlanticum]